MIIKKEISRFLTCQKSCLFFNVKKFLKINFGPAFAREGSKRRSYIISGASTPNMSKAFLKVILDLSTSCSLAPSTSEPITCSDL